MEIKLTKVLNLTFDAYFNFIYCILNCISKVILFWNFYTSTLNNIPTKPPAALPQNLSQSNGVTDIWLPILME